MLALMLFWEWTSKSAILKLADTYLNERNKFGSYVDQLQMLAGIGALGSTHIHADVKVYFNGKAVDFSEKKYQLATSYIHFEDGVGDVIHIHATGLTAGHMLNSVGLNLEGSCIKLEGKNYCDDKKNSLKFYVNGEKMNSVNDYEFKDLDRILISYGSEDQEGIQKQLDSVTHSSKDHSGKEMELN